MSQVLVHPRVARAGAGVGEADALAAMRSMIRYREDARGAWLAVGTDPLSRLIELGYLYDPDADAFLVVHAATPPSGAALRALGLER